MIRNADYVMSHIIDPTGRAKKAQVGVDLTLNKVSRIGQHRFGTIISDSSPKEISEIADNEEIIPENDILFENPVYRLTPGVYAIEFNEGLTPLPKNNTAMIINRSSVARSGAMIRSSVYDPGFATPAMGAILYVFIPIRIEQGARVAQILILENETTELYNGQYMDLPGLVNTK